MDLRVDISELFPAPTKNRAGAKSAACGEIDTPKRRADGEIDFAPIKAPLRPDRSMANAIAQEMSAAAGSNPSSPYARFGYGENPWASSILEHESAMETSKANTKQYRPSRPMGAQQYFLYRLRFIKGDSQYYAYFYS